MRVCHLTDLHVMRPPAVGDLFGKRLLGSVNLYVLGRKGHFSEESQRGAVDKALELAPDLVIITGDLTAQALDSEFEGARALLDPLLSRVPAVIIAGNHDTYVAEAARTDRIRATFGQWMGGGSPDLRVFGDVAVLSLETCRAALLSSGYTPPDQIAGAGALLAEAPTDSFVFLAMHYPLRSRRGEPYGPSTRALSNAAEVEGWLATTTRVGAILHGHEHHGFRTTVPGAAGPIPILNPGASGYAWLPQRGRTAHLNCYEVDGDGIHDVSRFAWDGARFLPEAGGAYASGG